MKDKNYMTISAEAEKALDKIQQPPMIKILNQVGKVDLHVSPETLKLLEENIGKRLRDMGLGNNFLEIIPKAQATTTKKDKWDYIN